MPLERLRLGVRNLHEVRQSLAQAEANFQMLATAEEGGVAAGSKISFALSLFKAVPFIVDVTDADGNPTVNYASGTVPADKVVSSVEYQSGELTVTIDGEVDGGPDGFTPTVTVTGSNVSGSPVSCTLSALGTSTRRYSFSQAITLTGAGDVSVESADGAYHTVAFTESDAPPDITTFEHGTVAEHQATQTRVKNTDTVSFSATFPAGASYFVLENFELHGTTAQEYAIDPTDTSISDTFTVAGSNGAVHNIKAHLKLASGATGNSMESTNTGLYHDSDAPTLASVVVDNYPAGQSALKDSETCDCTAALTGAQGDNGQTTDWSSILYSDHSTSELSIPSTTTYAETKTVTRISGDYRETGETANYEIVVTKSYNGTTTSKQVVVQIAHVVPVVTVCTVTETGTGRLRTDDGTNNYADRYIYLKSNQKTGGAPDATDGLVAPKGAWQGSWAQYGNRAYRRYLRIADGDIVSGGTGSNQYSWTSCEVKNQALKVATAVTTNPDYNVGGFESRELTVPAWPNREADIGCLVVDTTKLTCDNPSDEPSAYSYVATVGDDTPTYNNNFTISDGADAHDADNQYFYNCDFLNASINLGGTQTVDIEETA